MGRCIRLARVCCRVAPHCVGLRLAPSLGHGLGEIGEENGEPEPDRYLEGEGEVRPCELQCLERVPASVSMLPTHTTNMTGFRIMCRGLSLCTASRSARWTIGPWKSGCLTRMA